MMMNGSAHVPRKGYIHRCLVISYEFVMGMLFSLPRYAWLNWVKAMFLRLQGATIGKRVIFYAGVWIVNGRNLRIGDDVDLAKDVLLDTGAGITIGDRTLVGYRTMILSGNHVIPKRPEKIFYAGTEVKPVVIENDVWIGGNCVICPGVTVGEGAVVGANSTVTKSVAPFTIVGGTPAKLIRERD